VTIILLTNDDGIEAEGLRTLEEALKGFAHIVVVAPDQERSGVSHGLTLHTPLAAKEIRPDHYVLNGTPVDCVIFALRRLFTAPPDLMIAGINHGANLGDDIMYSGTVAAAREASRHGVPSLAVSQAYDDRPIRFKPGLDYVRDLVEGILRNGPRGEMCLNINIPIRKIKGVRITRQGSRSHIPHFNALDRGAEGNGPSAVSEPCREADLVSDHQAILENFISITPLRRDQTDYAAARALRDGAPWLLPLKR
jgi:5'-nucleotidase